MKKLILIFSFMILSGPALAQKITLISPSGDSNNVGARMTRLVVAAIGDRQGLSIELKFMPAKRAIDQFIKNRDKYHGIYLLPDSVGRKVPNLYRVEEPTYSAKIVAVSLRDLKINGWGGLKPYKTVHSAGNPDIETAFAKAGIKSHPSNSDVSAMRFLLKKRADVYVTVSLNAMGLMRSPEFKDIGFKILQPPLYSVDYRTFFYDQYSEIAKRYSEGLVAVKKDGTFMKIITTTK